MAHIIISVTLGGIRGKDCILRLRTSSWDIFDMLPMCLFSKGTAGFADCLCCLIDLESTLEQIHSNVQFVRFNVCIFYKGNFKCFKGDGGNKSNTKY